MSANKLIHGDNLEIMRGMASESVDLIYLDPPFFSNRNYEVIWGDKGEVRSFEDRWSGGMDHYIAWLKERVVEMHRLLKPTGSIFLHCDWHADAYIRVDILDKVFGMKNFRNHIIWKRKTGRGETNRKSNKFGVISDSIFFYSKNHQKQYKFNSQFSFESEGYSGYVEKFFIHTDDKGRKYRIADLSSPNPRPNLMYEYKGYQPPKKGWAISLEKMEQFEKEGRLHFPTDPKGRIQRKRFLDELEGKPIQNIWDDIEIVTAHSKERIGYPTQKPESLLERIIKCASNDSDIVLDPFIGGGTTAVVADKLQRQWIGIDQSVQAIKVTEMRLRKSVSAWSLPFTTQLFKYDYDLLRFSDAFEFESFIIGHLGGVSNAKQRGDFGIDGKMQDGTPIQVKRSDNIGRNVVDNFYAAIQRSDKHLFETKIGDGKVVGYIIGFSFGKGAIEEVARLKNKENVHLELVQVESIVPIAKKPTLTLYVSEEYRDEKGLSVLKFVGKGVSETGIEFYAWDFNYELEKGFCPDVFFDKQGIQLKCFATGDFVIACKVYDINGLENFRKMHLRLNGKVSVCE